MPNRSQQIIGGPNRSAKPNVRKLDKKAVPISFKSTLLYVAIHGLSRFSRDYAVRAASLCVIGYRILEHKVDDPEITALFERECQLLLAEAPELERGLLVRWHTSVRLIAGYLSYQRGERDAALGHFENIVGWQGDIDKWPQALTNILLSGYIAGYILVELDRKADAIGCWEQGAEILREGAAVSKFDNYYGYGELQNAVAVARECYVGAVVAKAGRWVQDPVLGPGELGLDLGLIPGPIGSLIGELLKQTGGGDLAASYKRTRRL